MIDWRLHTVTYSEVDANGFIGIQFDGFGEQNSGVPTVETHHPFGLMANPPEPDINGEFSCLALVGWDGDTPHAWLCADPRSRVVLPVLQKGEVLLYGCAGNCVRMHKDGRISLFTTDDNTPNGKLVSLQVKPDGFLFSTPWGKITFDATGFHVLHSSGAAIDLGAIGGLPPPLDEISSYVKLTAGMVQTEASIISNGTVAGVPDAATKATPLVAVLGALSTALADLATMLPTMTNGGGTVTAPSLTTTVAAIGAAVSAIGTAIPLLPSSSTGVT